MHIRDDLIQHRNETIRACEAVARGLCFLEACSRYGGLGPLLEYRDRLVAQLNVTRWGQGG